MALLSDGEISERLDGLEGWRLEDSSIVKDFKREDFKDSVAFVDALLPEAEDMGHHPDLQISWDTVTVSLSTHSQGGLTEADFALAGRIDALA